MCISAKPASGFAFRHASCRIVLFRRYRVSEVCRCGGLLLAFAASRKCHIDYHRNFGGLLSILADCRQLARFAVRGRCDEFAEARPE
jgi:hypothetical protein